MVKSFGDATSKFDKEKELGGGGFVRVAGTLRFCVVRNRWRWKNADVCRTVIVVGQQNVFMSSTIS
jgi:hypothetical protein